jgi:hypothetical protein
MHILTVEGLRGKDNEFVPKEIAIVQLRTENDQRVQSFLLDPPYSKQLIPHVIRKTNQWIKTHLNGLDWNDGHISFDRLEELLAPVSTSSEMVFSKGKENCKFFSELIGRNVWNLDNFDCPKATEITIPVVACVWNHRKKSCALSKCLKYALWCNANEIDDDVEL